MFIFNTLENIPDGKGQYMPFSIRDTLVSVNYSMGAKSIKQDV
jgi:hypothetical protein